MLPDLKKSFRNMKIGHSDPTPDSNDSFSSYEKKSVKMFISTIIFIITALLAVTVFGLNFYFDRQAAMLQTSIDNQKDVLKLDSINQLVAFDSQLKTLRNLVIEKGSYLVILDELAKNVGPGVVYNSAEIKLNGGVYAIEVSGTASSLLGYIRQVRIFENINDGILVGGELTNFEVRGNTSNSSSVNFTYSVVVPSDLLNNI